METPTGSSQKPLWSEEFSIQASEDKYVLRRQLTKFLVLTSFGMLAGNAWIWAKSLLRRETPALPPMRIAGASELAVGDVKLFAYPGPDDHGILVRLSADKFVAYSQKCTHLSCAVYYSKTNNRIECPCHEGYFSVEDGRVLQGPPPRPLPRIEIERRGNDLIAIGAPAHGDGE
jgi:nitrite reductase/ring-hydroxylating ferredoxin subunit